MVLKPQKGEIFQATACLIKATYFTSSAKCQFLSLQLLFVMFIHQERKPEKLVLSFKVKTDSHCLKSLKIISLDILWPIYCLNFYPFCWVKLWSSYIFLTNYIFTPFLFGQIFDKLNILPLFIGSDMSQITFFISILLGQI